MSRVLKTTPNTLLFPSKHEYLKFYKKEISNANNSNVLEDDVAYAVAKKIFEITGNHIVENEAGVVLDGFGYFALWKTPEKMKIRDLSKGNSEDFYFNSHSGGFLYLPHLFTEVYKNSILKGWSMDGGFSKKLKSNISKNARRNKRYKLLLDLVKSLNLKYRNKQSRKLIKNKKW